MNSSADSSRNPPGRPTGYGRSPRSFAGTVTISASPATSSRRRTTFGNATAKTPGRVSESSRRAGTGISGNSASPTTSGRPGGCGSDPGTTTTKRTGRDCPAGISGTASRNSERRDWSSTRCCSRGERTLFSETGSGRTKRREPTKQKGIPGSATRGGFAPTPTGFC